MRRAGKTAVWCAAALVAAAAAAFALGVPNRIAAARYPVRGVDVSNHQGDIDWEKAAASGEVRFAYIKATEGADFQDARFRANWEAAGRAGIARGAYHYFKTSSLGRDQAENFLSCVPVEAGCLPPAADLEEGGVSVRQFRRELTDFIAAVEARCGRKPVLYTTYAMYGEYVKGAFEGCPVWIRDVVKPPALARDEWLFWQYSGRGRLPGVAGDVDLDVFAGSEEDFAALLSR